MGRRRMFVNKRTISFLVEEDVYNKFTQKCSELGVTVSDVLREFVASFCLAEKVEERKTIVLNVQLQITKVEKQEEKERKLALQYVRELELQEFKEKLTMWRAEIAKTRNSYDCYNIKKAVVSWLKKLKDIDNETLEQAKAVIELCEKRLEQLRRL